MNDAGGDLASPVGFRFPAPAKLNLFLHVVGRRSDGYHLIESAMQLIDLCDTVTIVPRDDGVIARGRDLPGVSEADDLSLRAARLLQSASGTSLGATIEVDKRIPVGGGLGGGSSDAATVLLALNRLWALDWSPDRLITLGLALGADVPFFVGGTSAFVTGIGEALTPITLPEAHYVVLHPAVSVPTAAIFGAPELTRNSKPLKILDFSESGTGENRLGIERGSGEDGGILPFRNDLEPVAAARYPAVREALHWLSRDFSGARGRARMSGSGACVFRAFDDADQAAGCLRTMPARWSGWSVEALPAHPIGVGVGRTGR